MKFVMKKNFLFKLIVCLCIILILYDFTGASRVYASDGIRW